MTFRRTFAIISHPDAGKTTLTEKILSYANIIRESEEIKNRTFTKSYMKSDWMAVERKRGISVTTSVMQFKYKGHLINLLDTPGHEDFSEDTYRTLTAVDCCLMVLDAAKGVEKRTRRLLEIARLKHTPILTFINKLDRDAQNPISLIDDIESKLNIKCVPVTWPIGCGSSFKGLYHLLKKKIYLHQPGNEKKIVFENIFNLKTLVKVIDIELLKQTQEEVDLIREQLDKFKIDSFLSGKTTPIFFGSALKNFGVNHILDSLINWAPTPRSRLTTIREVKATEKKFTGFVFKIQANLDRRHRDRVAFLRIVSGKYRKGMKLYQVRNKKFTILSSALTFLANDRSLIEEAYPGDIIGLYNHGKIQIGDTFTQGENIKFTGIPNFAPEIFKNILLHNPLNQKKLLKALVELSEEGTIQIFRSISKNNLVVGAIGILQLEIVIARLESEYNVNALYEPARIEAARWIDGNNTTSLLNFKEKYEKDLAFDGQEKLVYLASTKTRLSLVQEKFPDINFHKIYER